MSKKIGVGLIGTGWIGRVHAEQYLRAPLLCPLPGVKVKLQAVADMVPELARSAAEDFGFSRWYTDWRELVADPEVNLVDICLPNKLHRDVAVAAAKAGKHIFCEKPLSTSADEGQTMVETVQAAGICHMVNFNYRRVPAIAFAKQLLDQNVLGDVYHFRAGFSQDYAADAEKPWSWQFDKKAAGGGSLVMMGPHVIDCTRYLVGDVPELIASLHTSVTERPKENGGVGQVNVDDSAAILLRFHNGCVGMLYTTWLAYGRKHHFEWEINASRGSLYFNSERLNELQICQASDPKDRQGFKTIYVGEDHPYGNIFKLKSGMGIGIRDTFLLQIYELLRGIAEERSLNPNFFDGWQVDRIIQAVVQSVSENDWVKL